jgi:plasmid stabilization system protein ParE
VFELVVAPRALAEVVAIVTWWQRNRRAAPRLFQDELDAALRAIAKQPGIGQAVTIRGYPHSRAYLLRRTGYIVLYDLDRVARVATVVRVRHGKRRPLP